MFLSSNDLREARQWPEPHVRTSPSEEEGGGRWPAHGKIAREVKVASEPDALLTVLRNPAYRFKRIGLEAGPLSQWLFSARAETGLPVICVETRHMRAVLKAQINKTDRTMPAASAAAELYGLRRCAPL